MIFSQLDGKAAVREWNRLFHSEVAQKIPKIIVRPSGEASKVQELNAILSANRALSKSGDVIEIDPTVRNSAPGSFIHEPGFRPGRVATEGVMIDSVVAIEGRSPSLPVNPLREYWQQLFDRSAGYLHSDRRGRIELRRSQPRKLAEGPIPRDQPPSDRIPTQGDARPGLPTPDPRIPVVFTRPQQTTSDDTGFKLDPQQRDVGITAKPASGPGTSKDPTVPFVYAKLGRTTTQTPVFGSISPSGRGIEDQEHHPAVSTGVIPKLGHLQVQQSTSTAALVPPTVQPDASQLTVLTG